MRRVGTTLTGVLLLAATGCATTSGGSVCPAIGYLDGLTVRLAPDWSPGGPWTVRVTCPEPCGPPGIDGSPGSREVTAPLTGSEAAIPLLARPYSAQVVVSEAGVPVADVAARLEWRRVGGSAECGGPMGATVVVPAP